jgi:hypothetical protein
MLGKDIDVTLDVTTVTVQFEGFESADQGIMGYEWAVGTTHWFRRACGRSLQLLIYHLLDSIMMWLCILGQRT